MPKLQGKVFHYSALIAGVFLFVFSLALISQAQSGPISCTAQIQCPSDQYCVAGKCNLPPPLWNTKFLIGNLSQDARIDLSGGTATWRLRADDLQLGFGNQINNFKGGEVAINYMVGKGFTVYDGSVNPMFRVDAQGDVTVSQKLKAMSDVFIGGYVGIGITNPAQKLDVNGIIQATGFKMPTGAVAGKVLTSDANGLVSWQDQPSGLPSGSTGQTLRYKDSSDKWVATSALTINDNNEILLDTTNEDQPTKTEIGEDGNPVSVPDYSIPKLNIVQQYQNNPALAITVNSFGGTYIHFNKYDFITNGFSQVGGIGFYNNVLYFYSGTNIALSGMGVGIGKASSGATLDVNGDLALQTTLGKGGPLGAGSLLKFASGGTATTIQENWGLNLSGSTTQPVKIPNASLVIGRITSNESFGVGNLEISGKITIKGGAPGLGKVLTSNDAGLASWQTVALPSGTSGQTLRHDGTNWVANSNLFNNGANVGIGTTAPGYKLDVSGNSRITNGLAITGGTLDLSQTDTYLNTRVLRSTGSDGMYIGYGGGGGNLHFYSNSGTSEFMTIATTGNVGIGTVSPGAKLEVAGQVKITGGSPALGKVLTSDATGMASWQTVALPPGTSGQTLRHDGTNWVANSILFNNGTNVGIGTAAPGYKLSVADTGATPIINIWNNSATSQWTGTRLARVGTGDGTETWFIGMNNSDDVLRFRRAGIVDAMVIDTAGNLGIGITNPNNKIQVAGLINFDDAIWSTFFGRDAGQNNSGNSNTATGYKALTLNTNGSANTATGAEALRNNTGGNTNTATGASALMLNITGNSNTATGASALMANTTGYNNTASGISALVRNTTGYNNTASGASALSYNTTGNSNTAIGFLSGKNITSGNRNIIIGYNIDAPIAEGSSQLSIGNLIFAIGVDGSGAMISTGNVGIGTPAPAEKLQVAGDIKLGGTEGNIKDANAVVGYNDLFLKGSATEVNPIYYGASEHHFYTNTSGISTEKLTILNNGNVGIGIATPIQKLDVAGTMQVTGFKMPTGINLDSKVLTSDANGLASWAPGLPVGTSNQTLRYNGTSAKWEATNNLTIDADGNVVMAGDVVVAKDLKVSGCFGPVFQGKSTDPGTGAQNGYVNANAKCSATFLGSHICTTSEVLNSINCGAFTGKATDGDGMWISNGAPSLPTPTNDCLGWTNAASDWNGIKWSYNGSTGGKFYTETCDVLHNFACCK